MDFMRKAHFIAGGHTTTAPSSLTYLSVVLHNSIQLVFLIAALNNINIMLCDLINAFLNAPCQEKIWFEGGIECNAVRIMLWHNPSMDLRVLERHSGCL
jgi:hypothetical protein